MARFAAPHQHRADRCPAADPQTGPMLLRHLSPENAPGQGVTIHAEAVVNDAHTRYLIDEADSRDQVEGFMAPFAQAGPVEVWPASSCAAVTGRGGRASTAAQPSRPGVTHQRPRASQGRTGRDLPTRLTGHLAPPAPQSPAGNGPATTAPAGATAPNQAQPPR